MFRLTHGDGVAGVLTSPNFAHHWKIFRWRRCLRLYKYNFCIDSSVGICLFSGCTMHLFLFLIVMKFRHLILIIFDSVENHTDLSIQYHIMCLERHIQ